MLAGVVLATAAALATDTSTPKSAVALHLSILARTDAYPGFGLVAAAEGERFVLPWLTVGGFVEGTLATEYLGDDCYYGSTCLFDYAATGALVGLHAAPARWIDLYARGVGGFALVGTHVGDAQLRAHPIVALVGRADLGIDFRIGAFLIGPIGSLVAFHARNGTGASFGARVGGSW